MLGTKLGSSERAASILDHMIGRNYHGQLGVLSLSFFPSLFFFFLTRSHYIDQAVLRLTEVSLPLSPKLWRLKAGFLLLMRTLF